MSSPELVVSSRCVRSSSGRPISAPMRLKSSRAARREAHDAQRRGRRTDADVRRADEVLQVVVRAGRLLDLALELVVDRRQLLVDRLQLLLARLELFGRRAQLLVDRLQFLVRGLQLLVLRLVLLDRRRSCSWALDSSLFELTRCRLTFDRAPARQPSEPAASRAPRKSPGERAPTLGASRTGRTRDVDDEVPRRTREPRRRAARRACRLQRRGRARCGRRAAAPAACTQQV